MKDELPDIKQGISYPQNDLDSAVSPRVVPIKRPGTGIPNFGVG